MKKIVWFFCCVLLILIAAAIFAYINNDTFLFTGFTQIIAGISGGFIAFVGVMYTLKGQQKQNNAEWERQLQLSREEWKRQNERYKEDWRIRVQPWFELYDHEQGYRLNFYIHENHMLNSEYQDDNDYSLFFERFSVKNTGKEYSFIHSIYFKSTNGSCTIIPTNNKRILPDSSAIVDLSLIRLYFKKNDTFEAYLLFIDIFENLYASQLILEPSKTTPYFFETINDNKNLCYKNRVIDILKPKLIKSTCEL